MSDQNTRDAMIAAAANSPEYIDRENRARKALEIANHQLHESYSPREKTDYYPRFYVISACGDAAGWDLDIEDVENRAENLEWLFTKAVSDMDGILFSFSMVGSSDDDAFGVSDDKPLTELQQRILYLADLLDGPSKMAFCKHLQAAAEAKKVTA